MSTMIKPSELKKDDRYDGRINSEIKKMLKDEDISIQSIVDDYIDKHITINQTIEIKHQGERDEEPVGILKGSRPGEEG